MLYLEVKLNNTSWAFLSKRLTEGVFEKFMSSKCDEVAEIDELLNL